MNHPIVGTLSLIVLAAASGCSKVGQNPNGAAPAASQTAAAAPAGTACDRGLIGKADVAGLLSEPISKVETLQGDPQSCVFTTGGFSRVTVALRPGLGDVTVTQTLAGQTNVEASAVTGVGDRAAWTDILKEINATKNNTLCDISAIGPASGGATKEKIAALCTKIFASM